MRTVLDDQPLPPHLVAIPQSSDTFSDTLDRVLSGECPPRLHFQSIVNLKLGVVAGYEALARFPVELGPAPDICFASAALVGRNLELEEVVVRSAFRAKALLPPDTFLTINVTPAFLLSDNWQSVLSSMFGLGGITIEITEQESIHDYNSIRERVAQIRSAGGHVAVDDACSGYASLQHVLEIHPSFIKLDRALIDGCDSNRAKSALIEMMGHVANRLDAWVIAEGVETEPELVELIRLGVPLAQGYFLGRPHPVMQRLTGATSSWICDRSVEQLRNEMLCPYVEPCQVSSTDESAHQMLANPRHDIVVITDFWDRPSRMVERHPLIGRRFLRDIMKVQVFSDPSEVLRRALTRPASTRFDPIVVIDAQGLLKGIVRVDRLMSSLLATQSN